MILSIFDGPNSEQKNANPFFPNVVAARHISDIFWAVNLALKFAQKSKKCVKRSAFDFVDPPGVVLEASLKPEAAGALAGLK